MPGFFNSKVNEYFKNETIQNCEEQIVPDEGPIPLFLLGHSTYPLNYAFPNERAS